MSKPIIWLYQFWLFIVSITPSRNCCGLKHQEYSHTFYRVRSNMHIIYRMGKDCLCWLYLVTIHIFRYWLTELPFCASIGLGRCTAPSTVFSQPYGNKWAFGVPFYSFKSKRPFRFNLMHGNTVTYHMYLYVITRHDIIAYVTWVGKLHQLPFFLKFVSCVIIWYKNVPLETWMKSFKGEPMFWKFALYFN